MSEDPEITAIIAISTVLLKFDRKVRRRMLDYFVSLSESYADREREAEIAAALGDDDD